jgi:predicted small secreted protein
MRLAVLLALLALAACNTVDGFGQDISASAQRVASWF